MRNGEQQYGDQCGTEYQSEQATYRYFCCRTFIDLELLPDA